jgi:16S rRNA (guanine527-N7)-methyltransferase
MFHVKLEGLPVPLSEPQLAKLRQYEQLLATRAVPMGFVSSGDRARLWERHILDSLRGIRCIRPNESLVIDLGSGAGLPGIPIAVGRPGLRMVLVEPKSRRAAFLEMAVESLVLSNVEVMATDGSALRLHAHLCLARALAPPLRSWGLAASLLLQKGRLAYWAGRSWGLSDVEDLRAAGVRSEICTRGVLAWQGPIVMMERLYS